VADRVILRRWRTDGQIIALFPDMVEGFYVNSYMHVGQHGEADYNHVVTQTTLVRPGDRDGEALLDELRQIGYDPIQKLRRQR